MSKKAQFAGPLWSSSLFDKMMITSLVENLDEDQKNRPEYNNNSHVSAKVIRKFFSIAKNELDSLPYHYVSDEFGKILRNSSLPVNVIVHRLQQEGYISSPTIFSSTGFKTDANVPQIKDVLTKVSDKKVSY